MPSKLCKLCNVSKIQLKTYVKCLYALINQPICITNNECLILHHKAFRGDHNLRSTKIILVHPALRKFQYCMNFNTSSKVLNSLHVSINLLYINTLPIQSQRKLDFVEIFKAFKKDFALDAKQQLFMSVNIIYYNPTSQQVQSLTLKNLK